ncbi:MAG: hypothetical protein A2V64_13135 [Bacteroidetes bacterium RBG_13_43_22]|nr:MAG: hypothetical protein A2V64_13135 [Bacteroidetes bacterium RBG_13_43_22]
MMNKKFLLILEIIWIITGILCIAAGIRYIIKDGGKMSFVFPLLALISFLFAWLRHRERKKP